MILDCNKQITEPTRQDHLLDLVLMNVPGVRTKIIPAISDQLPCTLPEQVGIPGIIWGYATADWDRTRSLLKEIE